MDPRGWTLARGFSPPPPRGARGRGSTRAAHPGSTSKQVSGLADRQSTAAVMMMMSLNRKTNWRRLESAHSQRTTSPRVMQHEKSAAESASRSMGRSPGILKKNLIRRNPILPEIPAVCGVGQLSALLRSHVQFGLDRFRPRARPFLSHRLPGSFEPRAGAYGWRTRASTGRCHSATAPT